MSRILALANQKGGVGKTTTTVNLASCLANAGQRVLLVDMDPQGNATTASGVDKHECAFTVYDLLMGESEFRQSIKNSSKPVYHVLPANNNLTAAEVGLLDVDDRENRLKNIVDAQRPNYDYIILDCPPSLSMLTVNALTAADGVIIPMQCEYFALEGLTDLLTTIKRVTQVVNPNLKLEGILRTMYDPRSSLTKDVSAQLEEYFGQQVYKTTIPRNIRLAEAPSHGVSVIAYDRRSKGAKAYLELADEVLKQRESMEADAVQQAAQPTIQPAAKATVSPTTQKIETQASAVTQSNETNDDTHDSGLI